MCAVREEASDLKGRVETLNEEGERRVKEVVAEVRVLQGLIDRKQRKQAIRQAAD